MNPSLTEALALLNLQPGEVYRMKVNGRTVEVRALTTDQSAESLDERSPFTEEERIELWLDIPFSPTARTITLQPGAPLWPAPFHLDESDLAPE
jgi:hypothetical protein